MDITLRFPQRALGLCHHRNPLERKALYRLRSWPSYREVTSLGSRRVTAGIFDSTNCIHHMWHYNYSRCWLGPAQPTNANELPTNSVTWTTVPSHLTGIALEGD